MDQDRRWLRHCHKKSHSWRGMCEDLRLASTGKLTPNWEGHQGREGHRGTGAVMQRCRDAGEAGEAGRTSGIGVDPPVSVKSVANLRSILLTERVAPNRRVPHPSDGPSYTPPSTGGCPAALRVQTRSD